MSGLNVDNFNLFAKKSAPKPAPMPIAANSKEVVENEIEKFDAEVVETPFVKVAAQNPTVIQEITPVMTTVEIERFDDVRPQMVNVSSQMNHFRNTEKNKETTTLRKFETFAAPTFRIPQEHDFELKRIEQMIMRNRKKGQNIESRERITSNTVVRALIANFLDRVGDMDLSNIDNEDMLKERMERVFKQKYNKKV
jgi:hypothetical protein